MITLGQRVAQMIGIGRIKVTDDSGPVQTVQIDQGAIAPDGTRRLLDTVHRLLDFGFASNPPVDSEALMVRMHGDRSWSIVVGTNHQPSRPRDLQPGNVMVYDVRGAHLKFSADGIEVDGAGLNLVVQNCPTVTVKASDKVRVEGPLLEVTGDIVSRADGTRVSLNALRDAYDAHAHGGVQ
ncbi:MAG: phage baseplate assembly protein, partial [Sphingomonadaceae bacterium]|nr:phage baseplate assembly protein [Sphingomonadaceae bacterium]MBV9098013.1 phage baseplate assembly protein [Frankiaceae bacterium]